MGLMLTGSAGVGTGHYNSYTTSDPVLTRDDELRLVEETLRRLNLTPEEAIKLVSAHIQQEKTEAGGTEEGVDG